MGPPDGACDATIRVCANPQSTRRKHEPRHSVVCRCPAGIRFAARPPRPPRRPAPAKAANPRVELDTTLGKIVIELDPEKAPKTVENFLGYVKSGFYDGTIFHRVIPGFMIQGGGFTPDMKQKTTQPPIPNEADNGLKNKRGTLSMARTERPGAAPPRSSSSTSTTTARSITPRKTAGGWGYAVFAQGRRGDGRGRQDRQREARQSRIVR